MTHAHLGLILGDDEVVGLEGLARLLLLVGARADHRHLLPKALRRPSITAMSASNAPHTRPKENGVLRADQP